VNKSQVNKRQVDRDVPARFSSLFRDLSRRNEMETEAKDFWCAARIGVRHRAGTSRSTSLRLGTGSCRITTGRGNIRSPAPKEQAKSPVIEKRWYKNPGSAPHPDNRMLDSRNLNRHPSNLEITSSSFKLPANAPEGRKVISHQMKGW